MKGYNLDFQGFSDRIREMVKKQLPEIAASDSIHEAIARSSYYEGYTQGVLDLLKALKKAIKEAKS